MAKWRSYPSRDLAGDTCHRSLIDRTKSALSSFNDSRKVDRHVSVEITSVGGYAPLAPQDLAAVIVARNEMAMLPSFLAHYRQLGVSRFIILDDGSEDGSVAFLTAQPDVDVWTSPVRFAEACGGMHWREALFKRYGMNRWYLNLDADEYLIYDRYQDRNLHALIGHLEAQGCRRLSAPMIDMYPAGAVEAVPFGPTSGMPWHIAEYFDRSGYQLKIRRQNMLIIGGPRHRKFGLRNQLMKSPLLYWDDSCSLQHGIHKPLPYFRNYLPISGVLLHFKFFADFRDEVQSAISDGQHYNNACEYKELASSLEKTSSIDFMGDVSERYEGPDQMIDYGFMQRIWRA
jgi:hypothetical protein